MTGPESDEVRDLRQAAIEIIRQLSARVETVAVRQERESTARRQADDLTRSVLQRAVVERLGEVRSEVATLAEELRAHSHGGPPDQQTEVSAIVQELERTSEDLRRLAESQRSIVERQSAMGTHLEELAAVPPPGDWSLVERIARAMNAQAEQIAALVASLDDARSVIVAVGESQDEQAGGQTALDQRLAELAANLPALVGYANELAANQAAVQRQVAELAAGQAALHQRVAELAEQFAAPPPAPSPGHQPVAPATPLAALEAELRDIEHRLTQHTGRPNGDT